MKKVLYALGLVAAWCAPVFSASAHVKWFVDSEEVVAGAHNLVPFYHLTSTEVIVWSLIAAVIVFLCGVLDSYIPVPKKLLAFGYTHEKAIVRVSQIVLGLFLITTSVLWKIVLVPEIPVTNGLTSILQIVEVVVGAMLILNIYPRVAAGVVVALCGYLFVEKGALAFLENAILFSLALFFFIKRSPADSWWNKLDKHAVEFVRIGTGVSLIVLAFTEKLAYPELGMAFLDVHNWNFMQALFPWFTNKLFVLSTGFAELVFGIVFILGYITRINTVVIAGFFGASVVTMMVQFHAWEVEDLVVYAAAILFIFYGHGKTKFFKSMWPGSIFHKKIAGKR